MKAIVSFGPKDARLVSDRPVPKLRDDYILVKNHSVALNPTDWKHIDFLATEGALVGCDFAGTVEEVGKDVTKSVKKGDRIAGFTHGVNKVEKEDGSFAEYIVAKGDVTYKIPDKMSFDEAATLGVGTITVGQGMFQSMGLPWPSKPSKNGEPILIYGGSSATGTLAVQFAKLAGLSPIATCSPRNFDLVKRLGAVAAFDYNDKDAPSKIREYTKDKLEYAFDTIALPEAAQFCCDSLTSGPGAKYGNILGQKPPRDDVKWTTTLAYTSLGEYTEIRGKEMPASAEDFDFAKKWADLIEEFLAAGKFEVHPPKVGPDGLKGVMQGLQDMRDGKVSGNKLVYRVSETP